MIDSRSEILSTSWTEPEHGGWMRGFLSAIREIAASNFSVLIIGEKGTGKTWAARKIHDLSRRSNGNFVSVDCIAMDPESIQREFLGSDGTMLSPQNARKHLLEKANGGTIFFDEIDALPLATQGEIAKILKSRSLPPSGGSASAPIDVRFIASLSRKPECPARESVLRTEMYHRMSTIIINLPPLRERREDIPHLIGEFLLQCSHQRGWAVPIMSPEALDLCLKYAWPGNIQELKGAIEGAVMAFRDGLIQKEDLPIQMQGMGCQHQRPTVLQENVNLHTAEKVLIERALSQCRTKKEAAAMLGISKKTLYNKLSRYRLYERSIGKSGDGGSVREENAEKE